MDFDLIIGGGTVYDGSGTDGSLADVGVAGDRIQAVGDLSQAVARRRIDATGLAVCPGFVDPHTHCHVDVDKGILHCDNLLRQGITTVISGNCGASGWPVAEHLAKVEREGFNTNYAMLVGHHTVHRIAMEGSDDLWPTHERIAAMQDLVRRGLEDGAIGITVGYAQRQETFEEIVRATRPAAEPGTVYELSYCYRSEMRGGLKADVLLTGTGPRYRNWYHPPLADWVRVRRRFPVPESVRGTKPADIGEVGEVVVFLQNRSTVPIWYDAVSMRATDLAPEEFEETELQFRLQPLSASDCMIFPDSGSRGARFTCNMRVQHARLRLQLAHAESAVELPAQDVTEPIAIPVEQIPVGE